MNQEQDYEKFLTRAEAEASALAMFARHEPVRSDMPYLPPLPGEPEPGQTRNDFAEMSEQEMLKRLEQEEALAAAQLINQEGVDDFRDLNEFSTARDHIKALNKREGIQARFFDDDDPYTVLWHADGTSSRIPKLAINRYLKKRDAEGRRIFFRIKPSYIAPKETFPCIVQGCRKRLASKVMTLTHADVYHPEEMKYLRWDESLQDKDKLEKERQELREERKMMKLIFLQMVENNPAVLELASRMGLNFEGD